MSIPVLIQLEWYPLVSRDQLLAQMLDILEVPSLPELLYYDFLELQRPDVWSTQLDDPFQHCEKLPSDDTLPDLKRVSSTDPCSICLDDEEGQRIELPCQHVFHESCVFTWLKECKKSCPVCRREL